MGLRASPNNEDDKILKQQQSSHQDGHQRDQQGKVDGSGSCSNNVIELYDIPDSDTLAEQSRLKKKYKYPLSEEEQKYIVAIMDKYRVTTRSTGTSTEYDYDAASRDHKLNYMQHSEGQLKKLAARYQLLDEEQRVVVVGRV